MGGKGKAFAAVKGGATVKSNQLLFRICEDLEGYSFNPQHVDGLVFSDPDGGFQIDIRSKGDVTSFGHGFGNLSLRCTTSREVSTEEIEFVEALIEGRYLKDHGAIKNLPFALEGKELFDSTGKLLNGYNGVRGMLPSRLLQLATEVDDYLRKQATRFLELLRWQLDAPGPTQILPEYNNSDIFWKASDSEFRLIPMSDGGPIQLTGFYGGPGLKWNPNVQSNFEALWADDTAQEPLGHQLLREAKQIQYQNQRSALLIAYTALEIGLKHHISAVAPNAAWLAKYAPSPPIDKILREYLPELHAGKESIKNWGAINSEFSSVGKFSKDRNRLAHRGQPIEGSLREYLRLSQDLLYAFDVLEGRDWAKSCVSQSLRKSLGWA